MFQQRGPLGEWCCLSSLRAARIVNNASTRPAYSQCLHFETKAVRPFVGQTSGVNTETTTLSVCDQEGRAI